MLHAVINIGNGNIHQDVSVSALTEKQVLNALEYAKEVREIADNTDGYDDRDWLSDFCTKYTLEYDAVFTLPKSRQQRREVK